MYLISAAFKSKQLFLFLTAQCGGQKTSVAVMIVRYIVSVFVGKRVSDCRLRLKPVALFTISVDQVMALNLKREQSKGIADLVIVIRSS